MTIVNVDAERLEGGQLSVSCFGVAEAAGVAHVRGRGRIGDRAKRPSARIVSREPTRLRPSST
jgi:hypothetical protein